jgi:hypothetical protein
MVIGEGVAALKSLRSLYEIAKEVRDSNDPDKLRAAAGQMFDLAFAAREQAATLQEERNEAVEELAALKANIEAAKRFDEKAVGYVRERNRTGGFVYREKGPPEGKDHSPYFCPNCFENKKFSMLNPAAGSNHMLPSITFVCPNCKMQTQLAPIR